MQKNTKAFFRPAAAAEYLDIGRTRIHAIRETDPPFPRKIRLGCWHVGWTKKFLDRWLEMKASQSEGV